MAVNSGLGKVLAVVVILAAVIVAIWLWGPLCALAGLFIVPATSEKGKALENTERAKILATDPAVVVASQSAELRAELAKSNSDIVNSAVADAERISVHLGTGFPTN